MRKGTMEEQEHEQVRTVPKTQCGACGRYFVGTSVFDLHRITDPDAKFGRRCQTEDEMVAAGLAHEPRYVKFRVENKPTTELQDVWYSRVKRENLATSNPWGKEKISATEDGELE